MRGRKEAWVFDSNCTLVVRDAPKWKSQLRLCNRAKRPPCSVLERGAATIIVNSMDSHNFEDPFVIIKNVRRREGNVIVRKMSLSASSLRPFPKKRKLTMESTKTQASLTPAGQEKSPTNITPESSVAHSVIEPSQDKSLFSLQLCIPLELKEARIEDFDFLESSPLLVVSDPLPCNLNSWFEDEDQEERC